MSFNPMDWLLDALEGGISFLVGDFLNWLLGLLLESIHALYSFNPVDLNSDWWRSTYAYASYFGMIGGFIIGFLKLGPALYRNEIKSMLSAGFMWARVFIVSSLIPVAYGLLLELSTTLREGARFGMTDEQMFGELDMFDGLGIWGGVFFVVPLVAIAAVTWVEVVTFELMAYIIAIGAGLYYGLKDAGGMGQWLWKKTLAFGFVTIFAPPIVIGIQSLGFQITNSMEFSPVLETINPDALVLLVFLAFSAWIPFKMLKSINPVIDSYVKGGRLQNSGKTQATMRRNGVTGPGLVIKGAEMFGEHKLDIRTAEHAASLRAAGAGGGLPPPKSPSGGGGSGAMGAAGMAVSKAHPIAGAVLVGADKLKGARRQQQQQKEGGT